MLEHNRTTEARRGSILEYKLYIETFEKFDTDNNGILDRTELREALSAVLGEEIEMNHMEILFQEFDKDNNGEIDFSEFRTIITYLTSHLRKSIVLGEGYDLSTLQEELNKLVDDDDESLDEDIGKRDRMSELLSGAIGKSMRDTNAVLERIATQLHPVRGIICVQDANFGRESQFDLNYESTLTDESLEKARNVLDPEFKAAYPPSDMRCLALVSHNGMKKTMREFVGANKNLLKKFRLTGTQSTMTMLKEVFKNEPPGTIVFGPACASGPLGGDAELVALMVAGRIGGILFFQDPMNAHPHRADIDCLVRQALVHNTMLAENPTSAWMLLQCLRLGLMGDGRAELIPSFFFSLQSPTVEEYKAQQKSVVDAQKALVSSMAGM